MLSLILTSVTLTCFKIMSQQFDRMALGLNLPGILFLNPGYESLSEEESSLASLLNPIRCDLNIDLS